ncbi:hypothetical protein ACFXPX_04710 [Kitasatospora sp. NPDC059146]|uniref:hypothetical protein n=1 Tax=unclassified Kitasatospora TaxID=2633591 RepID=UPI00367651F5
MTTDTTLRQLRRDVQTLARSLRSDLNAFRGLARVQDDEARATGRTAEQIAAMKVDQATVAETREVARAMAGLSQAAIALAAATETTAQAAAATDEQARSDHDGIQQARDRSPVEMADRDWYRQE